MSTIRDNVQKELESIYRCEYGRIVSYLTSRFGLNFIEHAEDIAQEALLAALNNWSEKGIPANPIAWIYRVSINKSINFLKRENKTSYNFQESDYSYESYTQDFDITLKSEIDDSMLKMIFVCCSDKLKVENQVLLVLSTLCGFSRKEIAQAFIEEEETIKKRLYRAKKKLRIYDLSLALPDKKELVPKLSSVQNSLYLLFNEGYNSTSSNNIIRKDICLEALRLAELLANSFKDSTSSRALLALFCFHIARFESRIDDKGAIVLFKNQDRSLWNKTLINKGIVELSKSSFGEKISVYHLEAGIAMQHCIAKDYLNTEWKKIHNLYINLYRLKPSPIIKLNLIIIESFLFGTEAVLPKLEALLNNSKLKKYYLLYATLGEFYFELNNMDMAYENFKLAKELTHNRTEIDLLNKKILKVSSLNN